MMRQKDGAVERRNQFLDDETIGFVWRVSVTGCADGEDTCAVIGGPETNLQSNCVEDH